MYQKQVASIFEKLQPIAHKTEYPKKVSVPAPFVASILKPSKSIVFLSLCLLTFKLQVLLLLPFYKSRETLLPKQ